jgi:hypothetical protein
MPESTFSYGVRRGTGVIAVASLGVAAISALMGFVTMAVAAVLVSWLLPAVVMIGHLSLSGALTSDEKAVWHKELIWKHRALVAVWAYLFAPNLGERTRGFRRYDDRHLS